MVSPPSPGDAQVASIANNGSQASLVGEFTV
jgi:hypothetical protein